jgi:hypothetical protein
LPAAAVSGNVRNEVSYAYNCSNYRFGIIVKAIMLYLGIARRVPIHPNNLNQAQKGVAYVSLFDVVRVDKER